MSNFSPYDTLFNCLNSGFEIVTVNQRLCQHLNKNLILFNKKNNHSDTSVLNQKVLTLDELIDQYLKKLTLDISFFDVNQTLILFEQLIENEKINNNAINQNISLNPTQIAKDALNAHQMLIQWQIDLTDLHQFNDHQESQLLLGLLKKLNATCQKLSIFPYYQKLEFVLEALLNLNDKPIKEKIFEKNYIFVGFHDYFPLLQTFINLLKKNKLHIKKFQFNPSDTVNEIINNKTIDILSTNHPKANTKVYQFNQSDDELAQITKEIFHYYQKNPGKKIGLIVPDLHTMRAKLENHFNSTFFSHLNQLSHIENEDKPYVISGGQSLLDLPIIADIMAILKLNFRSSIEDFIRMIDSPFNHQNETQLENRLALKANLKKHFFKNDPLSLSINHPLIDPLLEDFKKPLTAILKNTNNNLNINPLLTLFYRIQLFNWPGETSLSSTNYQAVKHFNQLLYELRKPLSLLKIKSYENLVQLLEKLLKQTPFQAESNPKAPISVLGLLESSMHYFDQLYVIRMNDQIWPTKPKPNHFLPLSFQKKHQMPHASSERELLFCQRLSDDFFYQSENLVISFAKYDDESPEIEQSLSPIFIKENLNFLLFDQTDRNHQIIDLKRLENTLDPLDENKHIHASSYLFKSFVTCPFQAQMAFRFNLEAYPNYLRAFDAKTKGNLIHQILEIIWQKIKTQEKLNQLDDKKLESLIKPIIANVISKNQKLLPFRLNHLKENEITRVIKLISNYLLIEKQREIPFSVLSHEKKITLSFQGLKTKLRIDRIDQLQNGDLWVIDYKTSTLVKPQGWFDESLSEPQLPIYALAAEAQGLFFSQINIKNSQIIGLDQNLQLIQYKNDTDKIAKARDKPIFDDFAQLKKHWHQILNNNAIAFSLGKLTISPKTNACQFCDFDKLCHYKLLEKEAI